MLIYANLLKGGLVYADYITTVSDTYAYEIQTPEYGGGEIYFDDVLIRKDGKFVLNELKDLN